ncbi:hypothetical protein OUZ56_021931 [Daphnia magna]|uniref:Uncharacterized protein n=1 Tax=Daphnia magna TaxID=35525 RepID=A0ABR0AUV4_9CRUS|nr:hypothetical protein OUZ56_021931 [Daphnia magna]
MEYHKLTRSVLLKLEKVEKVRRPICLGGGHHRSEWNIVGPLKLLFNLYETTIYSYFFCSADIAKLLTSEKLTYF